MDNKEAKISINFGVKTPNGFEQQITLREGATEKDFQDLMTLIADKEKVLLNKGYTPLPRFSARGGFPKREVEYVPDRKCPQDGGRLVKTKKKDGTPYVKCENNKWIDGKPTGCSYVEWPNQGGYTPRAMPTQTPADEEDWGGF